MCHLKWVGPSLHLVTSLCSVESKPGTHSDACLGGGDIQVYYSLVGRTATSSNSPRGSTPYGSENTLATVACVSLAVEEYKDIDHIVQ